MEQHPGSMGGLVCECTESMRASCVLPAPAQNSDMYFTWLLMIISALWLYRQLCDDDDDDDDDKPPAEMYN